jgi:hypothetical protein
MTSATGDIRSNELCAVGPWPVSAQAVTYVGSACVVEGTGDFTVADLQLVRRQFPDRLVTLDGDVITVWPPSLSTP